MRRRLRRPMMGSFLPGVVLTTFMFEVTWAEAQSDLSEPPPSTEEPAAEKPSAEKPSAEKPSAEKPSAEEKADASADAEEPQNSPEVPATSVKTPKVDLADDEDTIDANDTRAPGQKEAASSPTKAPAKEPPRRVRPPRPKVDYSKLPWTYHQKRIDLGAGIRVEWITDPAFDLFQEENAHPAFVAHGAYAFWAQGPLSIAAAVHYSTFSAQGEVRTVPSYLGVHRILAGAEARYHLTPHAYVYGRFELGTWLARSRLGDASDPARLEADGVGLSSALSLGSALRIAGSPDGRIRAPRIHVFGEGGLAFDSPFSLDYEMSEAGALRSAAVPLGSLSLGGPQIAFGAMVSY